jgi:hypothetical protein
MFFVSRRSVEEAIGKRQMVSSPSEDEFHMGSHGLEDDNKGPSTAAFAAMPEIETMYRNLADLPHCGCFFQNARNLRAHFYCGATRPDE